MKLPYYNTNHSTYYHSVIINLIIGNLEEVLYRQFK